MTAEEPGHQAAADAAAVADLVTHDIDTDDLFALVTAAEPEAQPEAAQQHGGEERSGQGSVGSARRRGKGRNAR